VGTYPDLLPATNRHCLPQVKWEIPAADEVPMTLLNDKYLQYLWVLGRHSLKSATTKRPWITCCLPVGKSPPLVWSLPLMRLLPLVQSLLVVQLGAFIGGELTGSRPPA